MVNDRRPRMRTAGPGSRNSGGHMRGRNDRRDQKPRSKAEIEKAREERLKEQQAKELEDWRPVTALGKKVKAGKIKDIDEALEYKILEPSIVDTLLKTKEGILNIGQAKGKFGGGKRRAWRQTQRKTSEGNVPTFSCMCVQGNGQGYIGMGYGRAKETLPARAKAVRKAKNH